MKTTCLIFLLNLLFLTSASARPVALSEPVSGVRHAVVIFAKFRDEPASDTAPSWAKDLFNLDLPGSLSHFYAEMSFGQFTLDGAYLPKRYTSDHSAEYYGVKGYGVFNREILTKVDGEVNFSEYDNDGPDGVPNSGDDDGYVDMVFINLNSRPKRFYHADLENATGIASLGLSENLTTDDPRFGGGFIRICGNSGTTQSVWSFAHAVGSMAHEFGHTLGLPDLYDTEYEGPNDDSAGIGNWGLMGRGVLGWHGDVDPDGPVPFCAWSRMYLGWIGELVDVKEDMEGVRLEDVALGGKVVKIQVAKYEYFLLENRQPTGSYYDRHIPKGGLLIWHIGLGANWREEDKRVDLECPDGLYRDQGYPAGADPDPVYGKDNLDFWAHDAAYRAAHNGNLGDSTDVFDGVRYTAFGPETNPASTSNSGAPTGIYVRNIHFEGTTAVVDVHPGSAMVVTDWLKFVDENEDGIIEAGEQVTVHIVLKNTGPHVLNGVQCILSTDDPYVALEDSVADFGEMPLWDVKWRSSLRFKVMEGFWGRHRARFDLEIRDDAGHVWMEPVEGEFFSPQLPLKGLLVLDGGRDTIGEFGNGDGVANPGETIGLEVVAEAPEDLAPFKVWFGMEDARVRRVGSGFLIASDTPEGHRIPFETRVMGDFSMYRDTLYVAVRGKDTTPPQVLGALADPGVLEPGSSTTIRVPKGSVVEGGSVSRMEARIYAWTDSQFVDTIVLQEGEEEFRGEWSYGEEGRFFLRIFAEDQAGNRMETRPLRGMAFYHLPERGSSSWEVYDTGNSGLPSNAVESLAVDFQRNLWIGTGGGLAKFDGESWEVYNSGNSGLPDNGVRSLAVDVQGNLWIGTGGGLAKFDGESWEVYNSGNSGLPDNGVWSLAADFQGNLWIGTWGGLTKFDGESWAVYDSGNSGLPDNGVHALAVDFWGNLWIGTWQGGLAKFDGVSWAVYDTGNSGLPDNGVHALAVDFQGNLWIGTYRGGLAKFDGERWKVYDSGNSGLPSNWVSSLAVDFQGNLWIGTGGLFGQGGGLAKFDGERWKVYDSGNSGLPSNWVSSLAVDFQGNLWIGTGREWGPAGGLAVYRGAHTRLNVVSATTTLGTTMAGQPTPLEITVVLDPPLETIKGYRRIILDLSPLGIPYELPLEHVAGGEYTVNATITPLQNGNHYLPIIVETAEGERDPFLSIPLEVYPAEDLVIYEDGPGEGWTLEDPQGKSDPMSTKFVRSGSSSHAFLLKPPGKVQYVCDDPEGIDPFGYTHLEFYVCGGDSSGQDPVIAGKRLSEWGVVPQADTWTLVSIPISEVPLDERGRFMGILIGGYVKETFYLDDMKLVAQEPPEPTWVETSEVKAMPSGCVLSQNVPNPFNPATQISFSVAKRSRVKIVLYNVLGQRVRTLVDAKHNAGTYAVRWDGKDDAGRQVGSGVYIGRLEAGGSVSVRKLVLLR